MKKRFASHKRSLKKGFHHSAKLQEEFNKYGEKNLIFNIVEEVFDVGLLSQREQFWINYYNSHIDGYNSCPIANSSLGFKHSVKTKLKMSLSGKKVKKDHPIKDKILILKKEIMKDKKLYIRKNGRCGLIAKNIGCSLQYLNKVLRQNI
jgi:group I intron endonuclease